MSAERVEAIRAEHVRHSGTWSGANDTGGLYCTCGDWEAGPDERGIRPWNEWHKHVAAALVAAETGGPTERLCSQCGERMACMVKVGTEDGWCESCLNGAATTCEGCLCQSEHDGDYGSSGHAGPCPPHTCAAAAETVGLVRDLRLDNADLARQLTEASMRRSDAYDEGYDTAMQHAHHVLNQRGYLERIGEDNGNPYRALLVPDQQTSEHCDPTVQHAAEEGGDHSVARLKQIKARWNAYVEDEPTQDASEAWVDHQTDDMWWLIEQVERIAPLPGNKPAQHAAEVDHTHDVPPHTHGGTDAPECTTCAPSPPDAAPEGGGTDG